MDTIKMKRVCKVLAVLVAAGGMLGNAFAEDLWFEGKTQELAVLEGADVMISISSEDGDIKVVGEDRGSVEITLKEFDLDDPKRNRARIMYAEDDGFVRVKLDLNGKLRKSDILLRVPHQVSLRLNSIDGDLRIDNIVGELEVSAVDGDVEMVEVAGGIVANAVDGDIRIVLSDTGFKSPISMVTVDGYVHLVTPPDLHADFSVSTIDGSFKSEIDYTTKGGGKNFWGDGVNLRGQFGEGGPPLSMKTIDGSILVKVK